jgi:hypothetical protein
MPYFDAAWSATATKGVGRRTIRVDAAIFGGPPARRYRVRLDLFPIEQLEKKYPDPVPLTNFRRLRPDLAHFWGVGVATAR